MPTQPPLPPGAPAPPDVFQPPGMFVPGGPPEIVIVATIAIIGIIVAGVVLHPLVRALARRLEGKSIDAGQVAEIDQLRGRVAELEQLQHRLAELEERVDFSERLLTQGRESQRALGGSDATR